LFLSTLSRVFFIAFLLLGCSDKKEIAFYHWKSSCTIKKDIQYPLYVKVLDISTKKVIKTTCNKTHIPVVYIDNKALKQRDDIADIVLKNIPQKTKEIQFDCDWTPSSKKKYFTLLKDMKKYFKKVTATIRLHQLRYPLKTGVPPVESGVLMFYNMSDFLDPKTKNYILDLDEAKKYLKNSKPYPLKLDLALPLYSMATVFRYNRVVKVIDDIKKDELKSNFIHIKDNLYKVKKTHYFHDSILYKDDTIRVDEVTPTMLKQAKHLIPFEYKRVIFFRLDSLKNWDIKTLKRLF